MNISHTALLNSTAVYYLLYKFTCPWRIQYSIWEHHCYFGEL